MPLGLNTSFLLRRGGSCLPVSVVVYAVFVCGHSVLAISCFSCMWDDARIHTTVHTAFAQGAAAVVVEVVVVAVAAVTVQV